MSEENNMVEEVEADVVKEGEKAKTMEDIPESVRAEYDGSKASNDAGAANKTAGTAYENTSTYVDESGKVFGIISLILGIVSMLCCCLNWISVVLGIAAVILGVVSIRREPANKTVAIFGIVTGAFGIIMGLSVLIIIKLSTGLYNIIENPINIDPEIWNFF